MTGPAGGGPGQDGAARRILITGAGGFVGRRLAAALAARHPGATLLATDRSGGAGNTALDVADAEAVDAAVAAFAPTDVAHLAALSAVDASFRDPRRTWAVNLGGTLNLTLAIQAHAPDCRLLFVSSAEVYGRSTFAGAPVTEADLLLPANPYAAAKAAADIMVQEAAGRGLRATILRPFNHTGPGQSAAFAIPAFCSQIAAIERGAQPPVMKVGALDDERDFLDVDDVVDLYIRAMDAEAAEGQVLNVASGRPRRIGAVIDALLAQARRPIRVEVDGSRLRATRVPRVVGDATRARTLLDWAPTRRFEDTLAATLEYWRAQG